MFDATGQPIQVAVWKWGKPSGKEQQDAIYIIIDQIKKFIVIGLQFGRFYILRPLEQTEIFLGNGASFVYHVITIKRTV